MAEAEQKTAYGSVVELNDAQALVLASPETEISFGGGWGNGKTTALVLRALLHHERNPGGRIALCRKTYTELEDTLMTEFFAICPEVAIARRNLSRHICELATPPGIPPTQVLFRHLDSRQAYQDLASLNLSMFGVDQAEEIDPEAYFLLRGRARHAGTVRESMVTHNPAGHNWLWEHFIRSFTRQNKWLDDDGTSQNFGNPRMWQTWTRYEATGRLRMQVDAITNINQEYLPRDYLESLAELPDRMRQRFQFSSYEAYSGLVFEFRYDTHVIRPFKIPVHWPKWRIIDHGQSIDPTVCLWVARDPETEISYYYREYVAYGRVPSENAKRIHELSELDGGRYVANIGDPSVFQRNKTKVSRSGKQVISSVAEDYYDAGIVITPAINTIDTGIERVNERLLPRPEALNPFTGKPGCPSAFIFSSMEYTINEVSSLPWDEKTEKPDTSFDDHACDCLRYFETTVPVRPSFNPIAERKRRDRRRVQYADERRRTSWMAA